MLLYLRNGERYMTQKKVIYLLLEDNPFMWVTDFGEPVYLRHMSGHDITRSAWAFLMSLRFMALSISSTRCWQCLGILTGVKIHLVLP